MSLTRIGVPKEFIPRTYDMNPITEDLIRGSELQEGMIVLVEDRLAREEIAVHSEEEGHECDSYKCPRVKETARWCRVTSIQRSNLYSGSGRIVSFIGIYADGTKRSRSYNQSYCWFVKKESDNR